MGTRVLNTGATPHGWSYYSKWLVCPRLGYFSSTLKLRPVPTPPALRNGLLAHAGLEAARDGGDYTKAIREFGRWIDNSKGAATLYPEDERKMIALVRDYLAHWKARERFGDRLRFKRTEYEIAVEFEHEGLMIPYTVRYDGIANWHEGGTDVGLHIVEDKTISVIRGNPAMSYWLDGQVTGQYLAWFKLRADLKRTGRRPLVPIKGVLMEFLSKSTPKKIDGERFIRRLVPPPTKWRAASWLAGLAEAKRRADAWKGTPESKCVTVPPDPTSCIGRMGRCGMWRLCHEGMHMKAMYRREG